MRGVVGAEDRTQEGGDIRLLPHFCGGFVSASNESSSNLDNSLQHAPLALQIHHIRHDASGYLDVDAGKGGEGTQVRRCP
jgi:hypothetical protein